MALLRLGASHLVSAITGGWQSPKPKHPTSTLDLLAHHPSSITPPKAIVEESRGRVSDLGEVVHLSLYPPSVTSCCIIRTKLPPTHRHACQTTQIAFAHTGPIPP